MGKRVMRSMLISLCIVLLSGCMASRDPVAAISIEPSSGYSPLHVHLEAQVAGIESDKLVYEWNVGDGAILVGRTVEHEFTGVGEIPVVLVVTDAQGRMTTVADSIRLHNRLPHAQFTFQPNPAPTHHPIHFDASDSFDPDGHIVSYHWDFGDGTTANGMLIEHEFETPSIDYAVVLTVIDDQGDWNSMYRILELVGCDH